MSESVNLRSVVLDILMEVNEKGAYSHVTLHNALKKFQYLDKNERAFITRLTQGTIEKLIYLDYVIDSFSKVPVQKMKPVIRNILRMSVYQILFMDGVPESAVCNEAVKLAAKRGFHTLKAFVNGVLRNVVRDREKWSSPDFAQLAGDDEIFMLHLKYSMPEWILLKWQKEYGTDRLVKILEAFEEESSTYVRCNTIKKTEEEIITSLKKQGVSADKVLDIHGALKISGYNYIAGLDAFKEGLINVQDISSMLVGLAAAPKENDRIIDVCAAPGGKSVHAALMLKGSGLVESRDISGMKVTLMKQTAERMGLANMRVEVKDALVLYEEDIESADIVLADLPCSGLGIMGRKPDIKYKMTLQKQKELVRLQREILSVVAKYVKKGGRLVFSTCTINREENEENWKWIGETLGLVPEEMETVIPERFLVDDVSRKTVKEGYLQLLPGVHGTDGFFVARFRKFL
ncbi:MAG: 16S rRNA (cytosine(967)-C(5))-methyltransferase RsmB [Thermoflexaceae bacterium]|nr:16S rRNA (cytosine(967)-C(5))-methyltransferase RsmB [Thermoflexaceae bacterium]